jgi:hypothetical protein
VTGRHSRGSLRARARARPSARSAGPGGPLGQAGAGEAAGQVGTIFRAEALESRARGAEVQEVTLHLGARWLRWLYVMSLGLVAGGIALAVTARTPEESYGTAVVTEPGGQFAALLPVAAVPGLMRSSGPVAVVLAVSPRPVRITISQVRVASPQLAAQAGLASPAQLSVLLSGRLAPGSTVRALARDGREHTSMALMAGSDTVGSILLGELQVMFGTSRTAS